MNTPDPNSQSRSDTRTGVAPSTSPANSASNPDSDSQSIRDSRGLSKLAGFSDRQLEHINAWLDEGVAYRKIAEFCLSEFLKEVPHMTIARYANRSVARTLTADLTDSKEAAAEISHYAATGDATFSTDTLELLEQKAFDLAAVYQRDNDAADLKTLTQLTSIINKARNTKVRERHATVQEQKLELHREELALKREIHAARLDGRLTPTRNLNSNLSPASSDASPCNADNLSAPSRDDLNDNHATPAALTSTDPKSETKNQKSEMEVAPKRFPTPNPLPHDIYLKNCAYTEKLLAGLVDPLTGRELPDPEPQTGDSPPPG